MSIFFAAEPKRADFVKCKSCDCTIDLDTKPSGENIAPDYSGSWECMLPCSECRASHTYVYADIEHDPPKRSPTQLY